MQLQYKSPLVYRYLLQDFMLPSESTLLQFVEQCVDRSHPGFSDRLFHIARLRAAELCTAADRHFLMKCLWNVCCPTTKVMTESFVIPMTDNWRNIEMEASSELLSNPQHCFNTAAIQTDYLVHSAIECSWLECPCRCLWSSSHERCSIEAAWFFGHQLCIFYGRLEPPSLRCVWRTAYDVVCAKHFQKHNILPNWRCSLCRWSNGIKFYTPLARPQFKNFLRAMVLTGCW